MEPKKILVVGATGQVGSQVVEILSTENTHPSLDAKFG